MITVSTLAARKIAAQLQRRGSGAGIRIGVKTTGCSGLSYVLEYVDIPRPEDLVFEQHGVSVWVDPKSYTYVQGVEIDWARNGLNEGFDFKNPNERDRCGCGESFRV